VLKLLRENSLPPIVLRPLKPVLAAFSLLANLVGSPESALAQPSFGTKSSVSVTTNFFTVTGTNRADLMASKLEARPWKTKMPYDATTEWRIHWNCKYSPRGGQYRLDALEIQTVVAVTLPRWIPPVDADSRLIRRWNQYVNDLGTHEQGHVALARQATAEFQRQAAVVPGYSSGAELTGALDRISKQVVELYRQKERDYDLETEHGFLQRANLQR
jgi:predicted secreted Zn-dependent protease